jgi:NHL repeat-containing protein
MIALALAACNPDHGGDPGRSPVDPCDVPGTLCTWMGKPGLAQFSPDELDRRKTGLYWVQDIVFGPDGTAFVSDFNNHRIVEVGTDGISRTIAGTGVPGDGPHAGGSCDDGCVADQVDLWHPSQVLVDPADPDVVYAAAWHDHRLVRIERAEDRLTWTVGTGQEGYDVDPVEMAYPSSVVAGDGGDLYFSDQGNQVVRVARADGEVEIVAGSPGVGGYSGDGGPAADALLHGHEDWVGGPSSKLYRRGSTLYVADSLNGVVRAIDLDTGVIDRVVGRYVGAPSGSMPGYEGDGGDALDAVLAYPRAVAFGPRGEMYVADSGNNCVRVVEPDGSIEPFAGRCGEEAGFDGDRVPALDATMDFPCGVSVDADGNVYVADSNNHVIRRIAAPRD